MTLSPSSPPVDVLVHTGPPEWWQIIAALGPLAILLSAILAAFISWNTLRQRTKADALALAQKSEADANALSQRTEADRRAEWWRRAQWALESSMDEKPEKQDMALAVLELLNTSDLAGPEETKIIAAASRAQLKEGPAVLDRLPPLPDNRGSEDPEGTER